MMTVCLVVTLLCVVLRKRLSVIAVTATRALIMAKPWVHLQSHSAVKLMTALSTTIRASVTHRETPCVEVSKKAAPPSRARRQENPLTVSLESCPILFGERRVLWRICWSTLGFVILALVKGAVCITHLSFLRKKRTIKSSRTFSCLSVCAYRSCKN